MRDGKFTHRALSIHTTNSYSDLDLIQLGQAVKVLFLVVFNVIDHYKLDSLMDQMIWRDQYGTEGGRGVAGDEEGGWTLRRSRSQCKM